MDSISKHNYKKDCRHCVNVGENIAGGTNNLFCQLFLELNYPGNLDPENALVCDFYKFNPDHGLYFHEIPKPECIYFIENRCTVDPLSDIEYCESCPDKGRFAKLSFNES